MSQSSPTDALLLMMSDREFVRVGALLGLKARAGKKDEPLVQSFMNSDAPFSKQSRQMLVTTLPTASVQ